MLALTSLISGGRSVGIVYSQTQATKFCFVCDRSGEYECGECPKAFTLCLARYFLTTCDQCVDRSNARSNLWEEYCNASTDISWMLFHLSFWTTLTRAWCFVICWSWQSLAVQIFIDTHRAIIKTFKPLINVCFLHSCLNVSEGGLCRKTQNVIFTHCSVAIIFKCDEPTIHRSKQTADTWWQQCLALKWHHKWYQLLTLIYSAQCYSLKKLSDSRNFLALALPTNGGRSVGIVRSQIKAT
jgi:hypothetical protein